jgi:lipopolysaccharide export system protein LptA
MNRIVFLLFVFLSAGACTAAEDGFTRITSDGKLILDYKKKIANFFENVVVQTGDGVLKSDKLTVFFDATGNAIDRMIAVGHVFIDEKDHQAESDRAEYYSRESRLVLTGEPVIKKGSNYYSAEIITIDTRTNKVYFEPSAKIVIKQRDDQ